MRIDGNKLYVESEKRENFFYWFVKVLLKSFENNFFKR